MVIFVFFYWGGVIAGSAQGLFMALLSELLLAGSGTMWDVRN